MFIDQHINVMKDHMTLTLALKLLQIASTGINYILKHMYWENSYFDIIGTYK